MRVKIHSERINSYGARVLTKGIDLTEYNKNGLVYFRHNRNNMPIGKCVVEQEGTDLYGTFTFDEEDTLGKEVKRKWEMGILNAASMGIEILETSEEDMIQGQTRPTVTKCILREVSVVDLPSNPDAYKEELSSDACMLMLSTGNPKHIDTILPKVKTDMDQKKIALALGLQADAAESEIMAKIDQIQATPNQELANERKAHAETVMSLGKKLGVINQENESTFQTLSANDPGNVMAVILSMQKGEKPEEKRESIAEQLKKSKKLDLSKGTGSNQEDRKGWTLRDWQEKDIEGLITLSDADPDAYYELTKHLPMS